MTTSVVVADDQPVVRAGIAMILRAEPDLDVVGEADDGHQAVELARSQQADVVVMDIRMPGMDGVAATRLLTTEGGSPDRLTKVLILTTFDDDDALYGALRAGASGYLLKHAAPRDLVAAVRKVAVGESWLDPAVAGRVIAAVAVLPARGEPAPAALGRLTAREREVLVLVAHGLSNAEIKERLFLSEATVRTHVCRILIKTGSRDRAQAVALAYQSGLVAAPGGRRTAVRSPRS